jgi:hypothetical protein
MSDYWSEDGDILVHERQPPSIGWLLVIVAMAGLAFRIASTWRVGVLANLLLGLFLAMGLLSFVRRQEFDRRNNVLRQEGLFGRKWTEPLNRFAYVRVFRRRSARGSPHVCVSLGRGEPREKGMQPEYEVAVYPFPTETDEKEARECGLRLARFLNLQFRQL